MKQLNVEIEITNTDPAHIAKMAIFLSSLVFDRYNLYNQYLFSFSSTRMTTGWIKFQKQDILDMIEGTKKPDVIIAEVIARKDYLEYIKNHQGELMPVILEHLALLQVMLGENIISAKKLPDWLNLGGKAGKAK